MTAIGMTAFRPDVAVIDRDQLPKELLWSDQSILLAVQLNLWRKLLAAIGKIIIPVRWKTMRF